ncbi:hypothetical protein FOG18_05235 [Legionella israelensis]|uniref:hypothetical protein n=1 Tax=Legionella israelensis TaxID=454 RepID=UPI001180F9D0|nr:hypothetical protein [Legionella israelensis]QDP72015.1 hypothetical protein FOG18_05235 [Legionella israelensis]
MVFIFNNFPSPNLFGQRHFRISYSLLPPIRNLIESSASHDEINVVSIACGAALELATFELLARSRGIKVNYLGCDINKNDLRFNARVLQKRTPSIRQTYIYADVASSPPATAITKADCIIWRHPEFLSDHLETPKKLILDMGQILWNILEHKDSQTPLLITCYDPHEMMFVLELMQRFCEKGLKYHLCIDKQEGRASWKNPTIDSQDNDPLFNLNHHDQCQLLITQCQLKKINITQDKLLSALSRTFQIILPRMNPYERIKPSVLLENLNKPDLDTLREAVCYLNNQIREHSDPFIKREQLLSLLTDDHEQEKSLYQLNY